MKPSLELKVSQQLTMTPQLQQAIRLLQLSQLELNLEVQAALEANPLLEEAEASLDSEHPGEVESSLPEEGSTTTEASTLEGDVQTEWEYGLDYQGGSMVGADPEAERSSLEARNSAPETLHDYLRWQVRMSPLSEAEHAIGEALIDGIDNDGYQTVPLEETATTLGIPETEVRSVHDQILQLDPVGVGARSLRECLMAQLDSLPADLPEQALTRTIIANHLEQLGKRDLKGIQSALQTEAEAITQAVELIRTLHPRPGARVGSTPISTILPDVLVRYRDGYWQVELNPEAIPRLQINPTYIELVQERDRDRETRQYIRHHLQQARWFLKSLTSRNETLLKVASAIVQRQQPFLEHGPTAMRPLTLKDIAEAVDLHESTVSRVTSQKYMHTPQGVFELKHFFSSHLATSDGEGASATAIRAMIQRMIAEEDPNKPCSDAQLVHLLKSQGIQVARRTVVKYRQSLGIPASSQRRSLGRG